MALTVNDLKSYYEDLLIIQYHNKPKAIAHIGTFTQELSCNLLPLSIQDAFDIDTAVGTQLDMLAEYVGAQRVVFYSGSYVTLSDSQLRDIIKFLIIKNNSYSSFKFIKESIYNFFGSDITLIDPTTMILTYFVSTSLAAQAIMWATLGYLPKPAAVGIGVFDVPTTKKMFAFRTYARQPGNVSGFNSYANPRTTDHWIRYSNKIA